MGRCWPRVQRYKRSNFQELTTLYRSVWNSFTIKSKILSFQIFAWKIIATILFLILLWISSLVSLRFLSNIFFDFSSNFSDNCSRFVHVFIDERGVYSCQNHFIEWEITFYSSWAEFSIGSLITHAIINYYLDFF